MAGISATEILVGVLALFLSLVFTLLIAVPFVGTVVRFRANYNPIGLQLDAEGGVQPHTGPVVTSYFSMMARVKRLEGWAGLYKGLMPTVLTTLVLVIFVAILPGAGASGVSRHSKYSAPSGGIFVLAPYSLFMIIISLPVVVITNRSITTPHKLPWFNPLYSLRILLTPTERRRPWVLFFTPGLLASEVSSLAYVIVVLHPLRRLLLPSMERMNSGDETSHTFSWMRISIYLVVAIFSTAVLCPLEVISTRLSIQKNHAASGFAPVAQEEELPEETLEYAGAEEDVIGLRNEDDPYTGMVDCAKRIVQEEGYRTLYRAWWLAFLGVAFGGL